MADQELPSDYDAIILGTGMTECIIAAALSRIGWKVLHLDRYDYYSGDWATFNFEGLLGWIQYNKTPNADDKLKAKEVNLSEILKEGEKSFPLRINSDNISNIKECIHVRDEDVKKESLKEIDEKVDESKKVEGSMQIKSDAVEEKRDESDVSAAKDEDVGKDGAVAEAGDAGTDKKELKKVCKQEKKKDAPKKWTYEEIKKQWRKFSIDLAPRILYCRGPMVELLISSDIAKYCTFRNITRILTHLNGKLEQVPCSRSDVFSSKQVSMIEKRMLMKLLTFAIEFDKHPEEYADFTDKPFTEFLKSKKLSSNVHHYVHNAIAMATEQTSTLEGLQATQKFLQSLGRYGNTAFLWPLYGSGELPQCFCRMCAVFGGIYCLRRSGTQLLVDSENKCTGIVDTEGQRLNAKYVVMEASFASSEVLPCKPEDEKFISRAILLTEKSILPSDKDQISLLCLPPVHENGSYITIYELSHLSCACPKDIFVVQISCRGVKGAEEDLKPTVESLFSLAKSEDGAETEKPQVLWSLFYEQKDTSGVKLPDNSPEGVFVVPSADLALDFDEPIQVAREIFDKLCPGEEFLPKAPNPEDIVFENDGEATVQGSGFEAGGPGSGEDLADGAESKPEKPSEDQSENQSEAKPETEVVESGKSDVDSSAISTEGGDSEEVASTSPSASNEEEPHES